MQVATKMVAAVAINVANLNVRPSVAQHLVNLSVAKNRVAKHRLHAVHRPTKHEVAADKMICLQHMTSTVM